MFWKWLAALFFVAATACFVLLFVLEKVYFFGGCIGLLAIGTGLGFYVWESGSVIYTRYRADAPSWFVLNRSQIAINGVFAVVGAILGTIISALFD